MATLRCPQCGKTNSEYNPTCRFCGCNLEVHSLEATRVPTSEPLVRNTTKEEFEPMGPGKTWGGFRIEERLDEGAMGTVYAAWDTRLERPVAIKILRRDRWADQERRRRLFEEAKLASSLNHRNIVTIYGIYEEGNLTFISMERLQGKTLAESIPADGLPVDRVLEYAQGAANGLAHAHLVGIVHRDIKPANTMITHDGQVKILDFGLAKLHDWQKEISTPHFRKETLAGTLPYMSPEQFRGGRLDARSDVFSFGVLLYQMLTGRLPFRADGIEALMQCICYGEPEPLSGARPDVPVALVSLVRRCLDKDPSRRPKHAGEVALAIKQIREANLARALHPGAEPGRTGRARSLFLALAAVVALGLGILFFRLNKEANAPLAIHSLAVLPLENLSGDASLEVFSNGFSAALSGYLGRLARDHPYLWIVPFTEMHRFEKPSAGTLHREFGVQHVIGGNLRHLGSKRRITLELIDAKDTRLLNSVALDVDEDVFHAAQGEALASAFQLLGWDLEMQSLSTFETADDSAYRDYVRGLGYVHRHDREGHLERAIEALNRAVARDPDFVPALAALSQAYELRWAYHLDADALEAAENHARQALHVRDDIADSHVALGRIFMTRGQYEAAAGYFRRALELDSGHKTVRYQLAKALNALDQFEGAQDMYEAAAAHAPYDWIGRTEMADFYYSRGRLVEAEAIFRQLIELAPQNVMGYSNLAVILYSRGALDEAETLLHQALAIQPSAWLHSTLGTLLYFKGNFAASAREFERAVALRPDHYLFYGNLADAYQALSEHPRAEEAFFSAVNLARAELAVNPHNHRIRSDMALYLAKLNRGADALAELQKIGEPDDVELAYKYAQIHELAGNRQNALAMLARALNGNYPVDEIQKEPVFASLRQDPGFIELLRKNQVTSKQ